MFDLGIKKKEEEFEDKDYTVKYLTDLNVGDQITGAMKISQLKEEEYQGKQTQQFYVLVIDHKNQCKWVCGIYPSTYKSDNHDVMIYGKQGSRLYTLIDTLNHTLNGTPLEECRSYSVDFETFRENINKNIDKVTACTVQSINPNAKSPNIKITKAKISNNHVDDTSRNDYL